MYGFENNRFKSTIHSSFDNYNRNFPFTSDGSIEDVLSLLDTADISIQPDEKNATASFNTYETQQINIQKVQAFLCNYGLSEYLSIGTIPLYIIGLILTGTSVYAYTRAYQLKTTVGYLLAFLSTFEFLFLLVAFEVFSISPIPFFSCMKETIFYPALNFYSRVYIYPWTHLTKNMCICISIMISIQQWIAVFYPIEVKNLCNMKRTKLCLLLSLAFSTVLSIPYFLKEKLSVTGLPIPDKKWENNRILHFITAFNDNVFNAFTIFFALFMINISIIFLLKWSKQERMRMTSQSSKDRRTSLMLLAVLVSYMVTHFPSMIIKYKIIDQLLLDNLPDKTVQSINPFIAIDECDVIVPSLPHKMALSTVSFLLTLSTLFPISITVERYFAMKNAEKYEKMGVFLGPVLVGINTLLNFVICFNVFIDEPFMDRSVSFSVYPAAAAQKMFTFFIILFCLNLLDILFNFLLLQKNIHLKNQLRNASLSVKYQLEEVYQSTKFSIFFIIFHIISFGLYVSAVVFFRYFGSIIVKDANNLVGIRTFSTTLIPSYHCTLGIVAIIFFNRIKSKKSEGTTIQMSSTGHSGANNYDQAIFSIWNSTPVV